MDKELEEDYLVTPEGKLYLTGFNEGYLLASVMPEANKALNNFKGDNPRLEGIRDGILQHTKEKTIDPLRPQSQDWQAKAENQNPERTTRSNDKDFDRD